MSMYDGHRIDNILTTIIILPKLLQWTMNYNIICNSMQFISPNHLTKPNLLNRGPNFKVHLNYLLYMVLY